MMKPESTYDLIIVGAGALGTWHAWFALEAGLRVLIIEKDAASQEATVRNFGQVVPSGFAPGRWHTYGRQTTQLYKELQEISDVGIRNNGSCYIASDRGEMAVLEELQQRFAGVDYHGELLTRDAILEKYPAVKSGYAVGGLLFAQEVSAEPELMIHRVQALMCERFGSLLQIRYRTPVIAITEDSSRCEVVIAGGQVFTAERCIVCSGREARLLFPELMAGSGMVVSKLNMLATRPLPDIRLPGNILTGLTIRRYESCVACDAWNSLDPSQVAAEVSEFGIHILFKQRRDGSIIIGDSHEYAPIDRQEELGIFYNDQEINRIMLREAARIVNLPDWTIAQQWCGFYAQHPDEIFTPDVSTRVHIATGIGGKGMTSGGGFAQANLERLGILQVTFSH